MIYLFDLGGVLLYSKDIRKYYDGLEPECSYEEFRELWFRSTYSESSYRYGEEQDLFLNDVLQKSGSKKTKDDFLRIIAETASYYPEALDLIRRLKREGKRICLLSNLRPFDYEHLCGVLGEDFFEEVFRSYQTNHMKPEADAYLDVVRKLGVHPSEITFFDDTKVNTDGAEACGLHGVQLTGDKLSDWFAKND